MNTVLSFPSIQQISSFYNSLPRRVEAGKGAWVKREVWLEYIGHKVENILDLSGQVRWNELLLSPPRGATVASYLSELTANWRETFTLAKRVIEKASVLVQGDDILYFVNLFAQDFSEKLLHSIPKNWQGIVLEVVETTELSEENVRVMIELRKRWYQIALDDYPLTLSTNNHTRYHLELLLNAGIAPIVKIDGKDIQWMIERDERKELKKNLTNLQQRTQWILVAEWAKMSHLPILESLEVKNLLAQWRELRPYWHTQ